MLWDSVQLLEKQWRRNGCPIQHLGGGKKSRVRGGVNVVDESQMGLKKVVQASRVMAMKHENGVPCLGPKINKKSQHAFVTPGLETPGTLLASLVHLVSPRKTGDPVPKSKVDGI